MWRRTTGGPSPGTGRALLRRWPLAGTGLAQPGLARPGPGHAGLADAAPPVQASPSQRRPGWHGLAAATLGAGASRRLLSRDAKRVVKHLYD